MRGWLGVRAAIVTLVVLAAIAFLAGAVVGGGYDADAVAASACPTTGPDGKPLGVDVHHALVLPADGVAGAARAALRAESRTGRRDLDRQRRGAFVVSAALAPYERDPRGKAPRLRCGARVWERTVIVALRYPHAPGASLSQGLVSVSRFRLSDGTRRYVVWDILH